MYVEDQINALRLQKPETALGWLICFESRPLQGIPPKGNGPHMLFFSAEEKARAFISGRKVFFGEEPLSVVGVDLPETLKSLALAPSGDPRYAAPPCGIVLDFDYATKKSRKILAPVEVSSLMPAKIAKAFGLEPSQAAASISEPAKPAPQIVPENRSENYAPDGGSNFKDRANTASREEKVTCARIDTMRHCVGGWPFLAGYRRDLVCDAPGVDPGTALPEYANADATTYGSSFANSHACPNGHPSFDCH